MRVNSLSRLAWNGLVASGFSPTPHPSADRTLQLPRAHRETVVRHPLQAAGLTPQPHHNYWQPPRRKSRAPARRPLATTGSLLDSRLGLQWGVQCHLRNELHHPNASPQPSPLGCGSGPTPHPSADRTPQFLRFRPRSEARRNQQMLPAIRSDERLTQKLNRHLQLPLTFQTLLQLLSAYLAKLPRSVAQAASPNADPPRAKNTCPVSHATSSRSPSVSHLT